MEEPTLLAHVVGQAVRELLGVGEVDDHVRPLLPLHAVHRRERDPVVGAGGAQHLPATRW